jgi:hypothetical protein
VSERLRLRQIEEDRAATHAAIEQRRVRAVAALAASSDPCEIREALVAHGPDLDTDACKLAWIKVVGTGVIEPTHESVKVHGRGTIVGWLLSRGGYTTQRGVWRELEEGRSDLWCVPNADRREAAPLVPSSGAKSPVVWLDAEGQVWSSADTDTTLCIRDARRATSQLILPKGHPLATVWGKGQHIPHRFHRVLKGRSPNITDMEGPSYAEAVVAILAHSLQATAGSALS